MVLLYIKRMIVTGLFYLCRVFRINEKKIVISNFGGRGYGGEGKLVADELLKLHREMTIIWLCREQNAAFPDGIKPVKDVSLASVYHQATAKIWIDNRRKPGYVRKRKGQYYIQLWHSGISLKCVEADAADDLDAAYIYNAKNDSKMADLLVAASEWRKRRIQEAFWYDGEILECDFYKASSLLDMPREQERAIRQALHVSEDAKLVLYAPTFRSDFSLEPYNIDYERLIRALTEKFGGEWVVAVRLHPGIFQKNDCIAFSHNIVDGTQYPSIEELAAVSQFLITDYSGTMFHAYRFRKNVIVYASDLEHYLAHERKLYFDLTEMPGGLARSNDELEAIIRNWDQEKYDRERDALVHSIGFYSDKKIDLLIGRIVDALDGKFG